VAAPPSSSSSVKKTANVRVVARIRPLAKYEIENGSKEIMQSLPGAPPPTHGPTTEPQVLQVKAAAGAEKRWFELDAVFGNDSQQQDVYIQSGAQQAVQQDLFQGFNCTILAYGQTGSGKTFTMGTASGKGANVDDSDGVIPRACADLFTTIQNKCEGNAHVELSYLEVYNEEIRDLMTESKKGEPPAALRIRETLEGEVYVRGLQSRTVSNPQEIGDLMEVASSRRVVASTKMNATSSRSHAICVLRIKGVLEDSTKFQAKLTLVDLAGSERIKKTGAAGGRAQEGININKGLFVLGQVVSALAEQRPKLKRKPPYRDSKLTRLLQDSLGGNSRTIMIACVSPADFNVEESVNTLRYATAARNIKNTATQNVVKTLTPEEAHKLMRENELLKQEVAELRQTIEQLTEGTSPEELEQSHQSLLLVIEKGNVKGNGNDDDHSHDHVDDDDVSVDASIDLAQLVGGGGDTPTTPKRNKNTVQELEQHVEHLQHALKRAKDDFRASAHGAAIELPAIKVQVEMLKEELQEELHASQRLEEESEGLSKELWEAKADASSARLAAERFSQFMDEMTNPKDPDHDKDHPDANHNGVEDPEPKNGAGVKVSLERNPSSSTANISRIRSEVSWVKFSHLVLNTFKEQMRLLGDYFEMVVRVVESPDILTMIPKSANQKRGWFGGRQEVEGESNLRKKLLVEHIKFFNERFLEIEDEITKRSDSVDAVLEGLGNDKKKLCDNEDVVEEDDDDGDSDNPGDDDGVLGHLTEILTGPILVW
jgi:hypothetical protein